MNHLRKKGFTLIEMLIVVAIIAVLAAILIPTVTGNIEQSRESADMANIRNAMAEVAIISMSGEQSEIDGIEYDSDDGYYHKYVQASQKLANWQSEDNASVIVLNGAEISAQANGKAVSYWDIQYLPTQVSFEVIVTAY